MSNIVDNFKMVQQASRKMVMLSVEQINEVLVAIADKAEDSIDFILRENEKDLDRMEDTDPKYDRLLLSDERIKGIASDIRNVATLDYPVGKVLMNSQLENGMSVEKVTVPLGVIGIIYEARPNVTFDVFSLCLKSGNSCVLKGSNDAKFSNIAIASLIHEVLRSHNLDENMLYLMPSEREFAIEMLTAVDYIDIVIPRGSQGLINWVRDKSKVPVIETGAGICHTYVDADADLQKAVDIVFNAKTRRVSVCNALDCMVIHKDRIDDVKAIIMPMIEAGVEVFADEASYNELIGIYPDALLKIATEESFGTEFLSHKMSIKTVDNLEKALEHIASYSSKHSECIISEKEETIAQFLKRVDAAAVYANVSTAFTDGAQFGLGAEIGISTQKLHARGPMALAELTSYKWIVKGDGQIRNS